MIAVTSYLEIKMGLFRDFMTSFIGDMKLGRDANHTLLEEDGTLVAIGDATCYEDENFDLINLRGVGSNPDPITIPTTPEIARTPNVIDI